MVTAVLKSRSVAAESALEQNPVHLLAVYWVKWNFTGLDSLVCSHTGME